MDTNREALQKAVDLIKKHRADKDEPVTGSAMAAKAGISERQLQAYLDGEEAVPPDLATKLKLAFGFSTVIVRHTKTEHVPDPPEDAGDNMEANRKSLQSIISFIKKTGEAKGMVITNETIALKMAIPAERLNAYLDGTAHTPNQAVSALFSAYADLFNAIGSESSRQSLEHTIVLIRNRGLAEGMDITIEDMAGKIGISREQLIAYLRDGYNPVDEISYKLETAYKGLIREDENVEITEDINMIIQQED